MEKTAEQKNLQKRGFTREITGLFLLFWTIFLVLCLLSFDKNDPTLNHVTTGALTHNKAGLFGAYVAGFLNEWFGVCSFLWPLFFVLLALTCFSRFFALDWRRWVGCILLVLFVLEMSEAFSVTVGDFTPGGIAGHSLYVCSTLYLSPLGAFLLWIFFFLIGLQLIFSLSWVDIISSANQKIRLALQRRKERKNNPNGVLLNAEKM